MRHVLVTGAAGFIGSHLVERLVSRGDRVTVLDLLPQDRASNLSNVAGRIEYLQGDVCRDDDVSEAFGSTPDLVYHLASVVGVRRYVDDPLSVVDVVIGGTRGVLGHAHERGSRVVLASTSEVFGRNPDVPWDEDADRVYGSASVERWSYGSAKSVAEHMLYGMMGRGLEGSIVRFFNAYGPRQVPDFVVSQSIWKVLRGERPLIYDHGEQTRCFTFVDDIIEGLVEVGERPEAVGLSFNLGRPVESTIRDVVHKIIEISGVETTPERFDSAHAYGTRYEDVPRRIPGVERARDVLGWEAGTPLEAGLSASIAWARRHPEWLQDRD